MPTLTLPAGRLIKAEFEFRVDEQPTDEME